MALDAMGSRQGAADLTLQDISNRQRSAAEAPEAPASTLKADRHALHSLSMASEEAQSCVRSDTDLPTVNGRAQQGPLGGYWHAGCGSSQIKQEGSNAEQDSAQQLIAIAEEEVDCILRATTRRAAHASSGNQTSDKAATLRKNRAQKGDAPSSRAESGSASLHERDDDSRRMSDADPNLSNDAVGVTCADAASGDDLAHSAACSTPGPSRRMQLQQDNVEVDSDDMGNAPTPLLPMTARRKGRFAAMQCLEVRSTSIYLLHLGVAAADHRQAL